MILIKNAETPESCGKCRIGRLTEDMNGDYISICPFLSRRVSLRTGQREKDCPIVDPTTYEQAMIEEILSEKAKDFEEMIKAGNKYFDEEIKRCRREILGEDKNGSQQD